MPMAARPGRKVSAAPALQVAARQFTRYKGMHENKAFGKTRRQSWLSAPEVLNPDGGIGKHHQAERRRGMLAISG